MRSATSPTPGSASSSASSKRVTRRAAEREIDRTVSARPRVKRAAVSAVDRSKNADHSKPKIHDVKDSISGGIAQTVIMVVLASLLFRGWQLDSESMIWICLVVGRWYGFVLVMVWRPSLISDAVREWLIYHTKHRGVSLVLLRIVWMMMTGTYDIMLLFGVNVWISLVRLHRPSIHKGELYRGERLFGRDERVLALTLLVMVSLPRLLRFLPLHQIYAIGATYGIVVFSLGHLRGNQRSKTFFGLMSFWWLVMVWCVAVGRFLMKEWMLVLEQRVVEKEVVVERVQYVPMEFWTGGVVTMEEDIVKDEEGGGSKQTR